MRMNDLNRLLYFNLPQTIQQSIHFQASFAYVLISIFALALVNVKNAHINRGFLSLQQNQCLPNSPKSIYIICMCVMEHSQDCIDRGSGGRVLEKSSFRCSLDSYRQCVSIIDAGLRLWMPGNCRNPVYVIEKNSSLAKLSTV